MSQYGDLLSAFPELIQEIEIFTMTPLAGGGYHNRITLYKKEGAFIRGGRSSAAIQGEARITNEAGILICFVLIPADRIKQGVYFEDEGEIFLINDDQIFSKEAGFAVYGCQLVQGSTDTQVEYEEIEERVIMDYLI